MSEVPTAPSPARHDTHRTPSRSTPRSSRSRPATRARRDGRRGRSSSSRCSPSPPSAARTGRTRTTTGSAARSALGMFFFGFGFVAWGKYLMPRGPFEEPRALMTTTPKSEKDASSPTSPPAARSRSSAAASSSKIMGVAGAVFGIVALFPLHALARPAAEERALHTKWRKGSYLTTIDGQARRRRRHRGRRHRHRLPAERRRRRALPDDPHPPQDDGDIVTKPGRETWGPHGYVAFSKVCTHAGCPVGLYEQLTEQLLCPCHQSLFDVANGALAGLRPGAAAASAAAALRRLDRAISGPRPATTSRSVLDSGSGVAPT